MFFFYFLARRTHFSAESGNACFIHFFPRLCPLLTHTQANTNVTNNSHARVFLSARAPGPAVKT